MHSRAPWLLSPLHSGLSCLPASLPLLPPQCTHSLVNKRKQAAAEEGSEAAAPVRYYESQQPSMAGGGGNRCKASMVQVRWGEGVLAAAA